MGAGASADNAMSPEELARVHAMLAMSPEEQAKKAAAAMKDCLDLAATTGLARASQAGMYSCTSVPVHVLVAGGSKEELTHHVRPPRRIL